MKGRADPAVPDRAHELRLTGAETKFRPEQVDDPGLLRGLQHRARFGGVARERLLAHDVLPGRGGGQHHRCMHVRRRCDGDDFDARKCQRFVKHGGRDAERRRVCARAAAFGRVT